MRRKLEVIEFDYGSSHYLKMCQLREEGLRIPLGLTLVEEDTRNDLLYKHFGVFSGELLIGGVMASAQVGDAFQLRQMIIQEAYRGNGIGLILLKEVEHLLLQNYSINTLFLFSRKEVIHFYEKADYHVVGNEFIKVGLPHFRMEKTF